MFEKISRRYGRRQVLTAATLGVAGGLVWRPKAASGSERAADATTGGPQWIAFGPSPTTSMYVNWSSGSANGASDPPSQPQVKWGSSAGRYGTPQDADHSRQVPMPAGVTGEPVENTFYSNALIRSLSPGTTYHYSVTNDGSNWSADRTFTTAGAGLPNFRFTAFGDQATKPRTSAQMVSLIASRKPAFHVSPGDLAYATPKGEKIPDFDSFHPALWDNYFNIISKTGTHSIPWMASVGAHEVEPLERHGYAGFVTRFAQPYDAASGTPVAHTFRFGNVAFIHLDGNDLSAQETINTGYSGGAQTAWLKKKLAGFRAAGSPIDFIVVVCDCCCYSTNRSHGSDGGLRDVWGPLFDKYHVDLVISGHVHAYERSNPMRAGKATRRVARGGSVHPVTDGTTYINAGGGGNNLYKTWYGPTDAGDAGNSTPAKIWRWRDGDSAKGGHGGPVQRTDPVKHFSAYRHAAWSALLVDVTAPTKSNKTTRMRIRAIRPTQSASAVTSIASPAVIDSVTLVRTHHG
jgi:hypothetical protein